MAIGVVVVIGVAAGVLAVLNRGAGHDTVGGRFGSASLIGCDDVARRAGNSPPKSFETPLQGSQAGCVTFADSANAVTVPVHVQLNTVQWQSAGFDVQTSAGYVMGVDLDRSDLMPAQTLRSSRCCLLIDPVDRPPGLHPGRPSRRSRRPVADVCLARGGLENDGRRLGQGAGGRTLTIARMTMVQGHLLRDELDRRCRCPCSTKNTDSAASETANSHVSSRTSQTGVN
ncbi:hypothetical protein AB0J55_19920 [Amycolatopsis sp. NPDC049688]|uniref:hypothetical protein n=1 Tax=Amycolatopsis sp. NPDC049688 TaxID=3154733 RepID=UPI00343385D8